MRKYILEVSLLAGLVFSLFVGSLANAKQNDLSDKLIRLHVIANSDSEADQALKYKVRDKILVKVSDLTSDAFDISESRRIISDNIGTLAETAQEVVHSNGFSYDVSVSLGDVYFPTREYDSFSLPAGNYEALRITIGNGDGKNWWCVLFPPLCVSSSVAEVETLAQASGLSADEISLMTSDEVSYKFKFKIIEIVEEFLHHSSL